MQTNKFPVGNLKSSSKKAVGFGWNLRKFAHSEVGAPEGKGSYWDEHELLHSKSRTFVSCPDCEWADLDGGRIVWAAKGKLFGGEIQKAGLVSEQQI